MNVLKGMSIGAMVPILELFAINAFEELEPLLESPEGDAVVPPAEGGLRRAAGIHRRPAPLERCSSVSVRLPDTTLIAHNEHWLAGDLGNVAVVIDLPEDGRVPVVSPTVVCCLPAVGHERSRGGQGIGSLTASDDGVGVPRVLVSRSSLEARSRADAVARAAMPGRAGGYGHVYAFAGDDAFTVETTGRRTACSTAPGRTRTTTWTPGSPRSAPPPPRAAAPGSSRLQVLIEERQPSSPEGLMEVMRDHDSARRRSACIPSRRRATRPRR